MALTFFLCKHKKENRSFYGTCFFSVSTKRKLFVKIRKKKRNQSLTNQKKAKKSLELRHQNFWLYLPITFLGLLHMLSWWLLLWHLLQLAHLLLLLCLLDCGRCWTTVALLLLIRTCYNTWVHRKQGCPRCCC